METGKAPATADPGAQTSAGVASTAASPRGGPRLEISLRWYDQAAGDIRVEYVLDDGRHGDGARPQTFVRRCKTCDATILVEKVRAEIGPVLGFLEPSPTPLNPTDAAPVVHAAPPREPARRRPLSRLGWAGVGLAIAAAVPFTVGVALVVRGKVLVGQSKGSELLEYKDYRPAGVVLLGAAAGLVATGVVLIIVDRVRARRDSRSTRNDHASREHGWTGWTAVEKHGLR